jgi:hypothetical protein
MQAQLPSAETAFAHARKLFEQTEIFAREGATKKLPHGEMESELRRRSPQIMLALYQGYVNQAAGEEAPIARAQAPARSTFRWRQRTMGCWFGHVNIPHFAVYAPGEAEADYSLDAALQLPSTHYSHGVAREVVEHSVCMGFEQAHDFVKSASSGAVKMGTRQMTETVQRAAQDIDAYLGCNNASTNAVANDTSEDPLLLVGSCDATGIEVIESSLRDSTRKAKADAQCTKKKVDPLVRKAPSHKHSKRMAMVIAVWEQAPSVRTPELILEALWRETDSEESKKQVKLPPREDKFLDASVMESEGTKVAEMFEEMQRRDPEHKRRWIVLVDGKPSQLEAIEEERNRLGVQVTLVVDLLHVAHYVWNAAKELVPEGERSDWVKERVRLILEGNASEVARGIRQSATKQKLVGPSRVAVDEAADYLLNRKQYLKYHEYLAEGLPIASGVIEGACRHLVNDRMDITGARWGLDTAEAILRLRALRIVGKLDDYWKFHIEREQERLYGEKEAA